MLDVVCVLQVWAGPLFLLLRLAHIMHCDHINIACFQLPIVTSCKDMRWKQTSSLVCTMDIGRIIHIRSYESIKDCGYLAP
jgi:hypothetical protein